MRIQQHSAYPHSRFRWAKFLGTCCTMAARHRSDTTQCRTAGKLATWTLEVSVWKNGKTWKRDFRKKVSTNSWSRITKTPMGRRDGKVQRVCVPVSSWLSCFKLFFIWIQFLSRIKKGIISNQLKPPSIHFIVNAWKSIWRPYALWIQ